MQSVSVCSNRKILHQNQVIIVKVPTEKVKRSSKFTEPYKTYTKKRDFTTTKRKINTVMEIHVCLCLARYMSSGYSNFRSFFSITPTPTSSTWGLMTVQSGPTRLPPVAPGLRHLWVPRNDYRGLISKIKSSSGLCSLKSLSTCYWSKYLRHYSCVTTK